MVDITPYSMENLTFIEHYDFEVPGHVYKNAVALGDVDNDKDIELIVGTMEGTLFVYKGSQEIEHIDGLGIITAVGVGDLMNCGSNALVIITGEGWCHVYLCIESNKSGTNVLKLQLVYSQRIPANTKKLLLCDIDGDGMIELVVSLTDRVIRSYRWSSSATVGRLVSLQKWECHDHIGSIILTHDHNGIPCLLVSQPNVTALRTYCPDAFPDVSEKKIDYKTELLNHVRNEYVSSEMVGDIKESENEERKYGGNLYAIATADGLIMLAKRETIIWTKNIEKDIFSLNKVSLNIDGSDSIVVCTSAGEVYLVDLKGKIFLFKLGNFVTAFISGMYTIKSKTKPLPCCVFVTTKHKVHIYYDMRLPKTCGQSLLACVDTNLQMLRIMDKHKEIPKSKIIQYYLYHYNEENED